MDAEAEDTDDAVESAGGNKTLLTFLYLSLLLPTYLSFTNGALVRTELCVS